MEIAGTRGGKKDTVMEGFLIGGGAEQYPHNHSTRESLGLRRLIQTITALSGSDEALGVSLPNSLFISK
jgi:hypothetical protein